MQLYKFEDYIFDAQSYELTRKGQSLAVRPKTLKLLHLLIQNKHRLVSKSEIMKKIWGTEDVRDYLLFQLVSEIRKLPTKTSLVRTQPNEGYQWVASTSLKTEPKPMIYKLVASVVVGVICVFGSLDFDIGSSGSKQALRLPAHKAFSQGVVALERQDYEEAIRWLEFSVTENPDSMATRLFLAEALFLNKQTEASLIELQSILGTTTTDAYVRLTATDLLSQISQQQGRLSEALVYAKSSQKWALQSPVNSKLNQKLGQCSADLIGERIRVLENMLQPYSEQSLDLIAEQKVLNRNAQTIAKTQTTRSNTDASQSQITLNDYVSDYEKQCDELKTETINTSFCVPLHHHELYARKRHLSFALAS